MKQNSIVSEAYLEPSRTSTTELFCENTPFFYKQFMFDPLTKNCFSFSKKSPQKIV